MRTIKQIAVAVTIAAMPLLGACDSPTGVRSPTGNKRLGGVGNIGFHNIDPSAPPILRLPITVRGSIRVEGGTDSLLVQLVYPGSWDGDELDRTSVQGDRYIVSGEAVGYGVSCTGSSVLVTAWLADGGMLQKSANVPSCENHEIDIDFRASESPPAYPEGQPDGG